MAIFKDLLASTTKNTARFKSSRFETEVDTSGLQGASEGSTFLIAEVPGTIIWTLDSQKSRSEHRDCILHRESV
jgi:hypothetical protein